MDTTTTTQATEPASASPTVANSQKIQWAQPGSAKSLKLEEQFEAARARNWISDRLIAQSQRHWNCTREEAIERLLEQQK